MGLFSDVKIPTYGPAPTATKPDLFNDVKTPSPSPDKSLFSDVKIPSYQAAPDPYFYTKTPSGATLGKSNELDASGKPYLGYRNPGDNATTTDRTRVATTFDPRVPQKMDAKTFYTPRAVADRAQLKESMGGSYSDQLDHAISLELAGSNNPENLRVEPNIPGSKNTITDPLENQLAKKVAQGGMSLFDAQTSLAKAKGLPTPWVTDAEHPVNKTFPKIPGLDTPFTPDQQEKYGTITPPKDSKPGDSFQANGRTYTVRVPTSQEIADSLYKGLNPPQTVAMPSSTTEASTPNFTTGKSYVSEVKSAFDETKSALKSGYDNLGDASLEIHDNPGQSAKIAGKATIEVARSAGEAFWNFFNDLGSAALKVGVQAPINKLTGGKPMPLGVHLTHQAAPGYEGAQVAGNIIGGSLPYILGGEVVAPISQALENSSPVVRFVGKAFLNASLPAIISQVGPLEPGQTETSKFLAGLPSDITFGLTSLIPNKLSGAFATGLSQLGIGLAKRENPTSNIINSSILTLFGLVSPHALSQGKMMTIEDMKSRAMEILSTDLGAAPNPRDTLIKQLAHEFVSATPEDQKTFFSQVGDLFKTIVDKYNATPNKEGGFVANPFADNSETPEEPSKLTADETQQEIENKTNNLEKQAEASQTDPDLKEMGLSKLYKDPTTKVLQPNEAKNLVRDIGTDLERFKPGLATEFTKKIDLNNATVETIKNEASQLLADAHYKKTAPSVDDAVASYKKDVVDPAVAKGEATIIGGDDLKDHFGKDYNDANHATYSKAAFKLYEQALTENKNPVVRLTGGGPGSGKTELITTNLAKSFDGIIYDSNFSNYEGAKQQIEMAQKAGKDVEVYGIIPDLERARGFTLSREAQTGRGISDKTFARGHTGFPETIHRLLDEGVLDPKNVHLIDTRNVDNKSLFQQLITKNIYAQDPLALLNKVRYNEQDVKELAKSVRESTVKQSARQERTVLGRSSESPRENRPIAERSGNNARPNREADQGKSEQTTVEKTHIEQARQADIESARRLNREETYVARKTELVNKTQKEVNQKGPEGILKKLGRWLYPLKFQDKAVQEIYTGYAADNMIARELANQELDKFDTPKKDDMQSIYDYQLGKPSEFNDKVKQIFDSLYTEAVKRGFAFGYRQDYLPGVYKNTPEEIQDAAHAYLKDQGMGDAMIKDYLDGKPIPLHIAQQLKLTPTFERAKLFPSYKIAERYGLIPKYKNIPALAAYWREQLERSAAGQDFIKRLIDAGKITLKDNTPNGWKIIDTPFSPKLYAAPPELAKMVNDMFRDENNLDLWQYTFHGTAKLSRLAQEIALSAGVPYTNINFFSAGQAIGSLTRALGSVAMLKPYQAASEIRTAFAAVRANFDGWSTSYFEKNRDYLPMMAEEGINLGERLGSYKEYETIGGNSIWSKVLGQGGKLFNDAFNAKTFRSFMAQQYTQTFKDVYEGAIKDGVPDEVAQKIAGETTKATFGLAGDVGRGKTTQDVLGTVFFAPRFRESLIGTVLNAGKSISTEFSNPAFARSRSFVVGAVLSFAMYQMMNKKWSNQYTWQNESGHEFDIRIPLPGGQIAYIPFLPSMFAFPRNLVSGGLAAVKGDVSTAEQKLGSLASQPLRTAFEVFANKDYFGNPIYKDTDSIIQQRVKIAEYIGLSVNHPYVKELVNQINNKKPLYQSIAAALEVPVSFNSLSKIQQQQFYDAIANQQKQRVQAITAFKPTYDAIQALNKTDPTAAQKKLDSLADEDYSIYKAIKTADKSKSTVKNQVNMVDTVNQVQDLIAQGKKNDAQAIVDGLTDAEYKSYLSAKKRMGIK